MAVIVVGLVIAAADDGGPRDVNERVRDLSSQILCPTCDGQSVLESNAPIAAQIRSDIAERVQSGATNGEIRAFYVSRYGPEALVTTPTKGFGALVWAIPAFGLLASVLGLGVAFRRWQAPGERRPLPRWVPAAVTASVLASAGAIGLLVVNASDERVGGEVATGGIRESTPTKLRTARALVADGEFDAARAIYDEVLIADPRNTDALAGRGALARMQGRDDDTPHTVESRLVLAQLLGQANQVQQMIEVYGDVLAEDPDNYEALLNRGRAFFLTASATEGDAFDRLMARARQDFAAAEAAEPGDVTALIFAALAAEAAGDLEPAYAQLEALLGRDDLPPAVAEDVALAFGRVRDALGPADESG